MKHLDVKIEEWCVPKPAGQVDSGTWTERKMDMLYVKTIQATNKLCYLFLGSCPNGMCVVLKNVIPSCARNTMHFGLPHAKVQQHAMAYFNAATDASAASSGRSPSWLQYSTMILSGDNG